MVTILCLSVVNNEFVYSQTDHEFWFAAPEITNGVSIPQGFDTTNIDRPIILIVSTADGPATIHITQPANPGFPVLTYTILTDQFFQIDLTTYIDQIECNPANTVLNNGLLITSDKPINAEYEIQNLVNSETYSLKGINALGKEFLIPSQSLYANFPFCNPPARNSFAIIATEDETQVKIVPSVFMEGQSGLDTIYVFLNRGQTWCGRALSADADKHLGGTFVFANKPVAITVTDDAVRPNNATGLSIDIAGDQLLPRELADSDYISMHLANGPPVYLSMLYIYAYIDSTTVNIDGIYYGTINRGGVLQQSSPNGVYSYIQCNHPVEVYQFLQENTLSSEVSGQIVPPLNCTGSRRVTVSRTGPPASENTFWCYLVTQNGNQANFLCSDPVIQSLLVPGNFNLIPSTGNLWGFFSFGNTYLNTTYTFSNTSGNFQFSTINELMPGALRNAFYTSFNSL